ncbi:hypothetical protein KAR91_13365, partial [Candidatus Pacearchaeota archaeon]|nr:hypothetical protein [Candidatus Pacearchaeota archaeon]
MTNPTQKEVNKFLTEAMGGTWHELDRCRDSGYAEMEWGFCICGKEGLDCYSPKGLLAHYAIENPDLSAWSGFGKLQEE